jgi:serine protease DegS
VIGSDPETDLAVLKIDLKNLPVIEVADSNNLQVGDVVLAIGNPFGLGRTVTQGIISALGRTAVGLSNIENFIQTDVALNPGSSGGALINTDGQLIGINTGIYTRSGGYQGVSFAIPVNAAENILKQIIKYGVVKRGWLGLEVVTLDPILMYDLKLNQTMGVVVTKVLAKSPALNKLKVNDLITKVNGQKIHDAGGFMNTIIQNTPGKDVQLTYYRDNQEHTLTLKLSADKSGDGNQWHDVVVKGKKHQYPDDRR